MRTNYAEIDGKRVYVGKRKCECADSGCKMGHDGRCREKGLSLYIRIDMEDVGGTRFCEGCAEDALESGLFAPKAGVRP